MKKLWFLLFIYLGVISFGGCQQDDGESSFVEKHNLLLSKFGFSVNPSSWVVNDRLVVLLADKRGVVLYELGKETILSEESATEQWLHHDGKNLYAFWWFADKDKFKYLKVRVSNDDGKTFAPAVTLNTDTGVLPEVSIASDGKGAIAVAYTDERKPGYGVYINYSRDGGVTWQKTDARLDVPVITEAMRKSANTDPSTFANSPKLAFLEGRLVAVWQQVDMADTGHVLRIVAKSSDNQGETWGSEANVFSAPNTQPVSLTAFNQGAGMYVFAMFPDSDKGFTGFYNTDGEAQTWTEISNDALGDGFNKRRVSWVKGAFSGDNLVLAFTSKATDNTGKVRADIATLSTKDHRWLGKVRHLDEDKGHELTKSTYPDIMNTGSSVVVVWEDYRSLVPTLYMDASNDNGKTWLPIPKPLTTPGRFVAKDPRLVLGKDKLWMTYFLVVLDGKNPAGARMYQEYTRQPDGMFHFPDIVVKNPAPKERLIERINQFWALREERKWEETWNYMEPVYRERFDKAEWLAQQGKLSFSKTVADESTIVITGNIAILDVNTEVSVNQQMSKEGLLESAPPKAQKVEMRWGWFYDDWYFMPDIIFGNHLEY